ncbi:uncharacterized protein LOC134225899 [Armigeres subalbatus]|uniref:uncharacterized protein LOC134225899 n=1 Tax=Armigeres subalbatus TaxID=124917 RepID=UPI002ED0BCE2
MPKQKWGTKSKQYCAEQEDDSYDQLYRKSDIFYEYLNDASCKIPKIEEHLADPVELLETIDNIDLPAHRLTGKVRLQYLSYLEKLLENNYEVWCGSVEPYEEQTFSPEDVKRCAASIEMKAVQSCMIMSLYRKYVLQLISQIRKETNDCTLHPSLINMKFTPKIIKKECSHVSVQTDSIIEPIDDTNINFAEKSLETNHLPLLDVPAMSLDEKIRNFERKMHISSQEFECKRNRRRKSTHRERSRSRPKELPIAINQENAPILEVYQHHEKEVQTFTQPGLIKVPKLVNNPAQDDEIMRELEAMFDTGDDGNIFESCENQVQIKAIINEIEKFEPSSTSDQPDSLKNLKTAGQQFAKPQREILVPPSPKFDYDNNQSCLLAPKEYSKHEPGEDRETLGEIDLRKSLWPCELHMQKMKLRDILSNIADNNYIRYERIRARFIILFGEYEDDEDELGPYSPSIELNEILVSSCRQRIAKWVVQALMKPLNDGLISNRFLFKKLAKHVADNIIFLNQYPDQRFIKHYVTDYFCSHPMISSLEDM